MLRRPRAWSGTDNAFFSSWKGIRMATIVTHRNIRIVTLEPGETLTEHCNENDIALEQKDDGWWTRFVGKDGEVESYDAPFNTYNEALWAAKAAAEFSSAQ
jgi:hypothetical protein